MLLVFFCDILDMDRIGEVFMKEKIKKFSKQYLIGFVIIGFVIGIVVCGTEV